MQCKTSHLLSLLVRSLKTKTLNELHWSSPFDKYKVYSWTNNVKVYAKGRKCKEATMILEQEVFNSGLVDGSGDLWIVLRKVLERESNCSKVFLMTIMENGVLIYGMPNLYLGKMIFYHGSCRIEGIFQRLLFDS